MTTDGVIQKIVVKYIRSYYQLSKIRITLDRKIAFKKFDFKTKAKCFFKTLTWLLQN